MAQAIVKHARERGLELPAVDRFHAEPGYGIEASIDGHILHVGADRYMTHLGVPVGEAHASRADDLAGRARTPLYAALDGRLVALLAVADPIKDGSRLAVQALRGLGIEVQC